VPRQSLPDEFQVGVHAPDMDDAERALIPIGSGNLQADFLPED